MRFVSLVLACLLVSTAARAQDAPPPSVNAMPVSSPSAFNEAMAARRGRGALKIVVGTVMLPLGFALVGSSVPLWTAVKYDNFSSCSNFACPNNNSYFAGAFIVGIIGLAVVGGGTALMALGAQEYTAAKPQRMVWEPVLHADARGGSAGLRLTF